MRARGDYESDRPRYQGRRITHRRLASRTGASVPAGAIFCATSHVSGDGPATAAAETFVQVTGADYLIEIHCSERGAERASTWAWSETEYIAVDVHDMASKTPVTIDMSVVNAELHQCLSSDAVFGYLDGNIANAIATAEVHGADMFAATLTHALTIQNHFSSVSGLSAIAA
jgi:hypothetical protein